MTEMAATVPFPIPVTKIQQLQDNVERVIRGKSEVVRLAIASLLARGHVLLEDVPGVGKTTLASALARSLSLEFQRIQFTSDLLPADIVGVTVYRQNAEEFEFVSGPIFTNILLADEINRATPKTQSALLEAMAEGTVSLERRSMALPDPFLVIATQNPIEHVGTYPLPESQLDRFLMRLRIGYPGAADERELVRSGGVREELEGLQPVLTADELLALQEQVPRIYASDAVVDYLMAIVYATRSHPEAALGVSTRGALTYLKACQGYAMASGRDYLLPEDVKTLGGPVLAHRVVLRNRQMLRGDFAPEVSFIERVIATIPVPR
jgi:MoxR-like ATPase